MEHETVDDFSFSERFYANENLRKFSSKLKLLDLKVKLLNEKVNVNSFGQEEKVTYHDNKLKKNGLLQSIGNASLEAVLSTSVHGYPNVFKSERFFIRVMWAIFFIISVCTSAW